MKVLFVGEGRHDIGPPTGAPQPRPASGVLVTLCRKIAPLLTDESVALSWREIPRFNPSKRGLNHKLIAAKELAVRHGCQGTIAVIDRDGPSGDDRIHALREGRSQAAANGSANHPIAVGVAIESIEAWTLGDPKALATVLEVDVKAIRDCYSEVRVEQLSEQSGKVEYQPKLLLARLAALKHRQPDVDFRADVANHTDIATLERNCPNGFAPFAADVRREFMSS